MQFDVTIEIPKGQRNKYRSITRRGGCVSTTISHLDGVSDGLRLIEDTLGEDGDPLLDAMVLLPPSDLYRCAGVSASGREVPDDRRSHGDDKCSVRPAGDHRWVTVQGISDVPAFEFDVVKRFFSQYKALTRQETRRGGGLGWPRGSRSRVSAPWSGSRPAD